MAASNPAPAAEPRPATSRREGFVATRKRRWRLKETSSREAITALAADLGCQPATAAVLANRGFADADTAGRFLKPSFADLPDPARMKNMDAALRVLVPAVKERRRIVIHGDYDVDGVSGASILTEFLRAVGGDAVPFIPDRRTHGYGFSRASLAECLALGAKIIITCDCGTASVAEVAESEAQGVPVIITDHHEPGPVLPAAAALLNPKQPGDEFPDKDLCGTGVAFFLIIALRRALREIGWFSTHKEPNLKSLLDVVAIATIGDVVPLTGVNRILVREGMPLLAAGVRPGIAALKEVATTRNHFDEGTIGFSLVPRINAAGRLGSAASALELILSRERDDAKRLALFLDGENKRRQEIEAGMLEEALVAVAADPSTAGASAIVLASERWHMGVVGIIAARMVDRFNKPAVVLAIGGDSVGSNGRFGRGSARGVRKVNLYDVLCGCAEHLVAFGGHAMAAGMTIAEEKIPAFREAFLREVSNRLSADDLVPELSIDAMLEPHEISSRLFSELTTLGPHGMSNPEPLVMLRRARVAGSRIVGNNHLRLDLQGNPGRLEAIGFGYGDANLHLPESLDLVVVPQAREWNGRLKTEFRIRDLGLGAVEKLGRLAD